MVKTQVKTLADIWLHLSGPKRDALSLASNEDDIEDVQFHIKSEGTLLYDIQKLIAAIPHEEIDLLSPPKSGSAAEVLKRKNLCKAAFVYTLKGCIHQLSFLMAVKKPLIGDPVITPSTYETLHQRFDVSTVSYKNVVLGAQYTNLHKLQKDGHVIIFVLEELIKEVEIFGTYTCVDTIVENHDKMKEEEERLLEEYELKKRDFNTLKNDLRTYETTVKEKVFKELDVLSTLTSQDLNDASEYGEAEKSYVKKWQESRNEQNLMRLEGEENAHIFVIDYYEEQKETEEAIHDDVKKFFEEARDDHYNEIELLMTTYDLDIESRDNAIYDLRVQLEKVREEKNALQEIYDRRAKEIKDYLEYKRMKEEKLARKLMKNNAATKIQAWWRGVMVRKKLGPYKPKGKNKKGDKKTKARRNKK